MRFNSFKGVLVFAALAFALSLFLCPARVCGAEEVKVKAEDVFPDNTLALISIPNLAATRAAFGKTQVADMFAQPEMQQFLAPAMEQLRKTYTEIRTKNPLLPALTDLDRGFLSGEITFGVVPRGVKEGQPDADGPPAGAVLIIKPENFESLSRLLEPALGGGMLVEGKPFVFGDEKDPNAPAIAQLNGRFLFGMPVSELNRVIERIQTPDAKGTLASVESFAGARAQLKFPAGFLFLNPAGALETVAKIQAGDPDFAKIKQSGKALGVTTLNAVLIGMGIANDELVMEGALHVAAGQKATGLVSLMLSSNEPVSKDAMKIAAADAPYVAACRIEWGSYLSKFREVLTAFGAGRQFDGLLLMVNLRLGFNLERDLIENLGSETVIVRTALDTSPPLSGVGMGAVFSIALKDATKVEGCLQKLQKSFGTSLSGNPVAEMVQFRKLDYNGQSIYYLKQVMSSTWSFAVINNRLLAGTSINAVKRSLDQLAAKDDILSSANFQQTIARLSGQPFDAAKLPGGFAYQTDESSGGSSLILTLMGVGGSTATLAALAEQVAPPKADGDPGVNFNSNDPLAEVETFFKRPSGQVVAAVGRSVDMGLWPDEGFFMKYRRARGAIWTGDPVSVYFRTELPFPNATGGGTAPLVSVAVIGMAAAIALPVLARARQSARRVSNANNLSQLGKALIMYADVPQNAEYPADASELYPDYATDVRMFSNADFPKEDVGYIYIPGSLPREDFARNVVMYENIPEDHVSKGRNVLFASGTVEFVEEAEFQELLKQTAANLKKEEREFKQVPLSRAKIKARKQ